MKKFLIFVLGLVIGGLAVYCFFPNTAKSGKPVQEGSVEQKAQDQTQENGHTDGKSYFEAEVEYDGRKIFQISRVLENGDAFAEEVIHISSGVVFPDSDYKVLLECDPEMPYYDNQVVQAVEGKKVLQLGIYRYKVNKYLEANTIPIIAVR